MLLLLLAAVAQQGKQWGEPKKRSAKDLAVSLCIAVERAAKSSGDSEMAKNNKEVNASSAQPLSSVVLVLVWY